jgi:hypothetical protein
LKTAQKASEPSKMGPVPFVTPPSTHPLAPGEPGPGPATDLGSAPTKALDDAVFASAQLLRGRGRTRRKVILLISDGINGAAFNHHNYEETLNALLSDNISVYVVAVGSNSFHSKLALMRKYANDSGGDIYYATRSNQMGKLYSRITEQARYEYTLAYVPRVYGTEFELPCRESRNDSRRAHCGNSPRLLRIICNGCPYELMHPPSAW